MISLQSNHFGWRSCALPKAIGPPSGSYWGHHSLPTEKPLLFGCLSLDAKETSAARVISHLKLFIKMSPGTKKPSLGKVCFQHVVPYHTEGKKKKKLLWLLSKYLVVLLRNCLFRAALFYLLLQKSKDPRTFGIPGLLGALIWNWPSCFTAIYLLLSLTQSLILEKIVIHMNLFLQPFKLLLQVCHAPIRAGRLVHLEQCQSWEQAS